MVDTVVCIPTFRRPEGLAATLASLLPQLRETGAALVVVDNDAAAQAGRVVAEAFLAAQALPGAVFVEARQGNCHAINRAFGEARTSFPAASHFLMIDDDEIARPGWLAAMLDARLQFGADIVGGPVVRSFPDPVDPATPAHPLFGSIEAETGPVPQIYGTGNCLITRRVFAELDNPEFDTAFNFLGGGDMDFFTRCRRAGYRFAWASGAVIEEVVLPERTVPAWLRARSLRTGVINFRIDRKHRPGAAGYALLMAKNAVSLGLSPFRAARLFVATRSLTVASHPPMMALGRLAASLGYSPVPYKATD